MGEDWDGVRAATRTSTIDLLHRRWSRGVCARCASGWATSLLFGTLIVKRDGETIDSLYGHLNSILARRGQKVARGQRIGTMGRPTANTTRTALGDTEEPRNRHEPVEVQKNLSNYYDPSQFIGSHRHLSGGGANFRVAMNTFTHDWATTSMTRELFRAQHSTAQSAPPEASDLQHALANRDCPRGVSVQSAMTCF